MVTNRETNLTSPPVQVVATAVSAMPGFYGWRGVAAAFTVAVFGWGAGFYGQPVYLEVVRRSRNWPIGLTSGAVTLHFLVGLAFVPNLPTLYRRFGLPLVTIVGGIATAIGLLGWALASST